MVIKYKVEGEIEIDLNKYQIEEFQSMHSETAKKAYLEKLFQEQLQWAAETLECELDRKINFDNLYITRDWDKYAGNMKAKNEQYGSPLAITLDDFPTTDKEVVDNTMEEIGERKQRHSKKWTK